MTNTNTLSDRIALAETLREKLSSAYKLAASEPTERNCAAVHEAREELHDLDRWNLEELDEIAKPGLFD